MDELHRNLDIPKLLYRVGASVQEDVQSDGSILFKARRAPVLQASRTEECKEPKGTIYLEN